MSAALIEHLHLDLELVGDRYQRDGVTIIEWRGVRDRVGLLYEMAETDTSTVRRWAFDEDIDGEIAEPVDLDSVAAVKADLARLAELVSGDQTRAGR